MTDSSAVQRAAYLHCQAFVDELIRSGVPPFLCLPGIAFPTPLALTIARHEGARLWMHIDERSARVFRLGHRQAAARARRAPLHVRHRRGQLLAGRCGGLLLECAPHRTHR